VFFDLLCSTNARFVKIAHRFHRKQRRTIQAPSAAKRRDKKTPKSIIQHKTEATSSKEPTVKASSANVAIFSPATCDKAALADCNGLPSNDEASPMFTYDRNIAAEMKNADPEVQLNKLDSCLGHLERSTIEATDGKGIVLGCHGYHFRDNTTMVEAGLEIAVRSRINVNGDRTNQHPYAFSKRPAAFFICGAPGIGKTTSVNYCCQQVLNNDYIWNGSCVTPEVVYINCAQLAAGGEVTNFVMDKIWTACDAYPSISDYNEKKMRKILTSTQQSDPKRFVILVLDEIDQLVHPTTTSERPQNKGEQLIAKLGTWSSDSDFRFAVIGIGNTMNGPKYRRIQMFLKVSSSCAADELVL
jgi:ATPase family associated with various cellular activities (AAA)